MLIKKKVLTFEFDMSEKEEEVFKWGELEGFLCGGGCNVFFEDGVDGWLKW